MRLTSTHRRILYVSCGILWLSGILWLGFHYLLRQEGEFGTVPHGLEKWWLRLHGLAVFATLVALGTLISSHGSGAWRMRRQRLSGMFAVALALWLAVSGYALFYLVTDRESSWLPVLHWGWGLAAPLFLWLHLRHRRPGRKPARLAAGARA